jgi:hypothetical protein
MEIGTKDSNLDASMSRTGGWNETMDSGQLEGWDWRRGVKVEKHSRLRLGLLYNGYGMGDLRGSGGIRWAGNRGDNLRELKRIQGLVQSMIEIRHENLRLTINTGNKVCWRGERIEGRLWR